MDKNVQNNIKIPIRELCYYVFFAVMIFAKGIGLYDGQTIFKICLVVGVIGIMLKILMTEHTWWELLWIGVITLFGLLVYKTSGEKGALLCILMVIGMKDVPLPRVFKVGLVVWGASFFAMVALSVTGVLTGPMVVHEKLGLGPIIRWGLGYPHPNVLHISYVILAAFILYTFQFKGKKLILASVFLFLGNCYIFLYSVSFTGVILTVAYLLLNIYFTCREKRSKVEEILIQLIFPVCAAFSLIAPLVLTGKAFEIADKLVNTRFNLTKYFLTTQKITLFGTRMVDLPNGNYTMDCSYVFAFMTYGIVLFAVIMAVYVFVIHRLLKTNQRAELAMIIAFAVAGMTEPFLFNTSFKNLTLLFVGACLFSFQKSGKRSGVFAMLDRSIQFLPIGNREITISVKKVSTILEAMSGAANKSKAVVCLAGIVTGVATAVAYAVTVKLPDSIFVKSTLIDYPAGKNVFLDLTKVPADFNSLVLKYVDAKTEMMEFTGNMISVEYARGIISWGLLGALAGVLLFLLVKVMLRTKQL